MAEHVADRFPRWLAWRRRAPGSALRRASEWWLPAAIAVTGIAFLAFGLEMSGPLTAAVLAAFAVGTVGMGLVFRGRAWCRYACPLGATLGLYGRISTWQLTTADGAAGRGTPPFRCPALLNPRRAVDPQHCPLCLRCLEAGAATIARSNTDGAAAAGLGRADAALAIALVGVLLADTVRMTPAFLSYLDLALSVLGAEHYRLAVALLPLLGVAAVAVVLGSLSLAGSFAQRRTAPAEGQSRRPGVWGEAASALVPVALAAQLALSLQHLVGSAGSSVQALAIELLPVPWSGHIPPADAYSVLVPLKTIQLAVLVAGAGYAALVALRRRTRHQPSSGARPVVAALSGAAFVGLFALPMSLAC